MSKLIILSGPIGCGKTELGKAFIRRGFSDRDFSRCKDKLFELTMSFFNIQSERFWEIYEDRNLKETPLDEFKVKHTRAVILNMKIKSESLLSRVLEKKEYTLLTCREAMIYISECICKPTFGEDYFGVARANSLSDIFTTYVDDSAFGTADEILPAIEKLGMKNIMLIRVHGRGTFDGDSRKYVPDGIIDNVVDIDNDGTLEEFIEKGLKIMEKHNEHK